MPVVDRPILPASSDEASPDAFAVRITGVDLADLVANPQSADWAEIDRIWQQYPILVFPEQAALSEADQASFVGHFGPLLEERVPGQTHSFVSNADGHDLDEMGDAYKYGALTAHMDFTYTRYPADGISLFGMAIPESGAETFFYSNVSPLGRMPEALLDRLRGYSIRCTLELDGPRTDRIIYREGRCREGGLTQAHVWPLVRQHPHRKGIEMLFCTHQQTERIVELSSEAEMDRESRELLDTIFDDYLYVPENTIVHSWRENDLVFWDNLAVQHARAAIPQDLGDRTLRRVSFCIAGNGIEETVRFLEVEDATRTFG